MIPATRSSEGVVAVAVGMRAILPCCAVRAAFLPPSYHRLASRSRWGRTFTHRLEDVVPTVQFRIDDVLAVAVVRLGDRPSDGLDLFLVQDPARRLLDVGRLLDDLNRPHLLLRVDT